MISIERMYKDIVVITEENYTCDRYSIMENLFNELDIIVLDFEVRIKQKESVLGAYMDIVPYNVDEDMLSVLKKLDVAEEEAGEELIFTIKMLAVVKM